MNLFDIEITAVINWTLRNECLNKHNKLPHKCIGQAIANAASFAVWAKKNAFIW